MKPNMTALFVVPTGNSLPTTGKNNLLTNGQVGIFLPDGTAATPLNVGSAKYIQICQDRNIYSPNEGTKNSDFIYPSKVINWYKVPGSLVQNFQITEVTGLTAGCNEDISVTIRLDSYYIRSVFGTLLTRSVITTTPCCSCADNPCDTLSDSDIQNTIETLAVLINQETMLKNYVVAGTSGTGATTKLVIEGLPLANYAGNGCDLNNFPYQRDRLNFRVFVRSGPDLTTDYEVDDACNTVGTVTILQRASYPQNPPAEVQQMEKNYFSYLSEMNEIFSNPNFNPEFESYVDTTAAYDLYYLRFTEPISTSGKVGVSPDLEEVILAFKAGDSSETNAMAVLTAFLGTPDNEVSTPASTTTISTSSSTTTSSTTNIFP